MLKNMVLQLSQINLAVFNIEKHILPTVPPLGDVEEHFSQYGTGESWRIERLAG
jgi:hypothetical protein